MFSSFLRTEPFLLRVPLAFLQKVLLVYKLHFFSVSLSCDSLNIRCLKFFFLGVLGCSFCGEDTQSTTKCEEALSAFKS